jgi:signal transduction histidine kinase
VTASSLRERGVGELRGSVLVVDDDRDLQDTLCDILNMTGVHASGVSSAGEATRWCYLHNPDLVVLDQQLPDASGLQLAAMLKARTPLMPIILLTGHVSTDTAIAAVGVVDDYLTKPVPPNELVKIVETRLEQYRLRVANQDLVAQLQEANNRLEHTVQARTRELSAARDQAMEGSRLKSQFLANMSHEIRTPMNGVLGAAEILWTTELSAEQRSYVEILTNSGQTLLAIINDVLDFSKIEAGRLELDESRFVLREIFVNVVKMLATQAAGKGLELRLDIEGGVPATVVGDAGRLRQVVTNLVGNAVKFTDTGHVLVTVSALERSSAAATVRCDISDTGIGIAEEDIPRLFSDFTQVDPSHTRRFGGTGLGLAICDRLVKLMGGEIGCTPNPGPGSTFWLTLPFELPQEVDPGRANPTPQSTGLPLTEEIGTSVGEPLILVVEDNEINGVIMTRMLTRLGYRSHTARSGADALEAVVLFRYAAILMDCQMPVMDGFTTTARLRAEHADGPRIPIVAITATATTEDQARCLAAGMDDYLPKPILMSQLAATLGQWAAPTTPA